MPRLKSENKLESLKAQERALQQKIKEVEAHDKAKKARDDHRRWELAGQVAVQQMQTVPDGEFFKTMMDLLDRHARSAADRALFGLTSPKSSSTASGDGESASLLP